MKECDSDPQPGNYPLKVFSYKVKEQLAVISPPRKYQLVAAAGAAYAASNGNANLTMAKLFARPYDEALLFDYIAHENTDNVLVFSLLKIRSDEQ